MLKRHVLILLLAVGLMVPAVALAHTPRTVTQNYILGTDLVSTCTSVPVRHLGGVCFNPLGAETAVTLVLEDDAGYAVAASYSARDEAANTLQSAVFCESITVTIPAGTTEIRLWMDGAFGLLDCPLGTGGPATTGTVTAHFV